MFDRRGFLRRLGESAAIVVSLTYGIPGRRVRAAEAGFVAVRPVTASDAPALQAIMTACVRDGDSFFGKCGEWSRAWAEDLVTRCPDTVILASGGTPIAVLEIPPIRSAAAPPAPPATTSERQRDADRRRNRTTLRVTAAGVRDDLLDREQSVTVGLHRLRLEVCLKGRFWQRDSMLEAGAVHSPVVEDFAILLPQVIVDAAHVNELRQAVDDWLADSTQFSVELAVEEQSLAMTCGARADFVATAQKPVCTIRYAVGGSVVVASFVVDQSCLRSLSDDLRRIPM